MPTPTKSEVKRLQEAVNWSYRQLSPFRKNDLSAMKEYVGRHYSDSGSTQTVPMAMLELAVTTYTQRLSGGKPRMLATTKYRELEPQKAKLQRGTNHLLEEIRFHETLADATQGGFFSMGIVKSGLNITGRREFMGYLHDVAQPFADSVTIDNWVHDMTATRPDMVQFEGDRFDIDLEDAKEMFEHGDKLTEIDEGSYGDSDETRELSQGERYNRRYYRKKTRAFDIWDPRANRVITLAANDGPGDEVCNVTGEYVHCTDWNGPETGPYRKLRFNPVRGNIMPLPPVALWRDFHDLSNNIMRKLARQAQRQKIIYGVRPGGDDDGKTVIRANDGDMVKMADPKNIATINYPGIAPEMLAFLIQIKNMASWMWGNLDALGGLSPQADTLGQDKLLTASASQRLIRMQGVLADFALNVMSDLAQYLYSDPFIVLPQVKRYGNISVPITWTPEDREADFLQYNIKLEPYSLQYRSPSERLETIRQTMQQLVMPFSQSLAAQGISIDFEKLFRTISEYANLPELDDMLIYSNPQHPQEGPARAMQSPVTNRTNTRVNRPGATSQGKDEAMISHLLGQGQQQAQTAQIARPTG